MSFEPNSVRRQRREAAWGPSRRATRRQFSTEEKIRIVLEGLRGEDSIAELCRRAGIATSMYYGWSKKFLEAGKKRLAGDTRALPLPTRCANCAARPVP